MYDIADAYPAPSISGHKTANITQKLLSGLDAKNVKRTKQKSLILLVVFMILCSTATVNLVAASGSLSEGSDLDIENGDSSLSDSGSLKTGSISGFLWADGNGLSPTDWNGLYDAGERPLANYPVYLYEADDLLESVAQTKTASDGTYIFDNLEPGNYIVELTVAFVDGSEYLLPIRITPESVFTIDIRFTPHVAHSEILTVTPEGYVENINAGMRLPMGFMLLDDVRGEDWIEIWTPEDLRNIQKNLSGKYIQMADIDLESTPFTPIGNSSSPFTGTYDGNRYKISGLNVNGSFSSAGLFGYAQNSNIMNITLDSSCEIRSSASSSFVGGIVGYAKENVNVTNCYNKGNVSTNASSYAYIGGIVGLASGNISVVNCYITGNVNATGSNSNIGGILGYASGNVSVRNCYNIGSMDATGVWPYAGGIIGQAAGGNVSIDTCYNTGEMNITLEPGGNSFAGGMIGLVQTKVSVNNCYNTATLNIVGDYIHAGGIIGYVYRSGANVTNCYNTGDVILAGFTTVAGGILGDCLFEGTNSLENCYNTGNIAADFIVGGLVGYAGGNASMRFYVTDSHNTGYVERGTGADSSGYAGGVIGWLKNGYASVTDCYNTGNVSSFSNTNTYAGGIIGHAEVAADLESCYNTGDVSGKTALSSGATFAHAGGIIGYAYSQTITVTNCYSTGDAAASVAATNGAGGIIGFVDKGKTFVTNSYNTGSMTSNNAGGLVGQVNATGSLTCENVYFLDNNELASGKGTFSGSATQITSEELQNPNGPIRAFSTLSGNKYAGTWTLDGDVNDGYPILTSIQDSLFTVILISFPSGGGNVFGGAAHADGSRAAVKVFPERGYQFARWEENGVKVGCCEEYIFTVTGSRKLVAVFEKTSDSPTVILHYVCCEGKELRPEYVVTALLTPGSVYSPADDTDILGNKLTDVKECPNCILTDWKLSTDSEWAGNTDPSIIVSLGTTDIILRYGRDSVDDNGDLTGDGIEDVNVTMKWASTTGAELKPPLTVAMNVPGPFDKKGGNIDGYTYMGYRIGGSAPIAGTPRIELEKCTEVTVTYIYRADDRLPSRNPGPDNPSIGNYIREPTVPHQPLVKDENDVNSLRFWMVILLYPIAIAAFLFSWRRQDEEDEQ